MDTDPGLPDRIGPLVLMLACARGIMLGPYNM